MTVTFKQLQDSPEVRCYIENADATLKALGYTEHSFAHVTKCAQEAGELLLGLGYDARTAELARIAGFLHDIGNVVNRVDHAQSGALMAHRLLQKMEMEPEELCAVISAIGHHDEETAFPVNAVAAALILADKSDVRRSRVRNQDPADFDIHDRVNFAVERSNLKLYAEEKRVTLTLDIDSEISPVMDYFEIFLGRMLLCRKAATFFELKFSLMVNGVRLL